MSAYQGNQDFTTCCGFSVLSGTEKTQSTLCLLSRLCVVSAYSAPLPEMLPDDIGPAALWEALESNAASLRAAHTAEIHTQEPQDLPLCLTTSSRRGS